MSDWLDKLDHLSRLSSPVAHDFWPEAIAVIRAAENCHAYVDYDKVCPWQERDALHATLTRLREKASA